MKTYTDLNQSKKLAEILKWKTADMTWVNIYDENHMLSDHRIELIPFRFYQGIGLRAWSLAALLDVLPYKERIALAINDYQGVKEAKYAIGSVENDTYDCYADNPIDACYEMIIKLHDLKLL